MTVAEKRSLIEEFRHAVDEVEASVKGVPAEALDYLPPIPDAWPIRAQIAHLLDADMYAWARIRKSVAQPDAPVDVWDQEAWASKLDYGRVDLIRLLDQIRIVRDALADFLESIVEQDWSRFAMDHPERGRKELPDIVKIYVDHVAFHQDLIKRNLAAYRAR